MTYDLCEVFIINNVQLLLKENGPLLSGELARKYELKYKVSNDAARKAISRSKSPVQRINTISFEKNQMFYYLEEQYKSEKFKNNLINAIKNYSKINYTAINAIMLQGGYVSKDVLPSYVLSPVNNLKGHRKYERVINDLIKLKIIQEYNEEYWMLNPEFFDIKFNYRRASGIEVAKKLIIDNFNKWAKNINFIAFDSGKGFFDRAEFGNFQWCFTSPSYIQTLYNFKNKKPGFIIADVIFGKTTTVDDIYYFIEKVNIIRQFKCISNFIPFLFVDKIEPSAFKELKRNNIVVGILNNFYDKKYVELLNDIVTLFTNANAILYKNPNKIEMLFNEIAKSEDRYNDIVGDLFEFLVGYYYQNIGCNFIRMKEIIETLDDFKKKEIDILLERDGKIIIIECKATRSKLNSNFTLKWLNDNIPVIRKWVLEKYPNKSNIEFQLWSIGGFDNESIELLEKAKRSKKYEITYFDKDAMIKMAKESNSQIFLDILKQHFK